MIRAFIAVPLSDEIRNEISVLSKSLKGLNLDASIPRVEGVHLTLKFLGNVEESRLQSIYEGLGRVAQRHRRLSLSFKGLGVFPHMGNPRVVWIGVKDNSDLLKLQSGVDNEMEKQGFSREKRNFHPHLTIARVKSRANIANLLHFLESEGPGVTLGSLDVVEFHLYQSLLRPEGAEYRVLSTFRLT